MKNVTNTYDRHINSVLETLKPSTRKPPTPSDRLPRLHQSTKKSNGCLNSGFVNSSQQIDQQLDKLRLYRSFIMIIGSYLERSSKENLLNKMEIKELIKDVEICLGLREGKLNISQFGKMLIKFDTIAPFKYLELTSDLKELDAILQAYGDKLASEHQHV